MKSQKTPVRSTSEWTVDSFCDGLRRVLRRRLKGEEGEVDESDVRSWAEQLWPLPPEAAFNIVEWAQAYVSCQRAKPRSAGRGGKGDKDER